MLNCFISYLLWNVNVTIHIHAHNSEHNLSFKHTWVIQCCHSQYPFLKCTWMVLYVYYMVLRKLNTIWGLMSKKNVISIFWMVIKLLMLYFFNLSNVIITISFLFSFFIVPLLVIKCSLSYKILETHVFSLTSSYFFFIFHFSFRKNTVIFLLFLDLQKQKTS